MSINNDSGHNSQFYADMGSLQKLKQQAKTDTPEALKEVAQQFEQMFLGMLMKSMREANATFGEDNVFSGGNVGFYQGMLDNQLTQEISQAQGIGLSDVLARQLSHQLNVRIDDDDDKKTAPLSDAEQLLNRAFDQGASAAASSVLGQRQANAAGKTEFPPSITPISETVEQLAVAAIAKSTTTTSTVNMPDKFESPEEFVATLLPLADEVAAELGVDPKVLLAQAALETGWGQHIIRDANGNSSNNLFNIKADKRWDGERAQVNTLEYRDGLAQKEKALFRSYDSYEQSFRDYADFLKTSPRYQHALDAAANPRQYLQQLQAAGYATDPAYADKITTIFESRILAMGLNTPKEG
ncbi:flagellar assembly peptidoglycan hydrolase FlgJ [Neptunomonas antarctica]|uniref:Peptidoglycan hydrolase FlgJ n=1 Tax=Neptunomonas antarctica TaxID=619304 RepID=A0A1N7JC01_9GAMM|nr:flagellar assembly peptidoglycan hydrolase FlgJ [Neptunomonas antarctica]SIS46791.1 flagellar protein FlgJ [Neptunomonas antarctica]